MGAGEKEAIGAASAEILSKDAEIQFLEDKEQMKLVVSVLPPEGSGADVTVEALKEALKGRRVVYGIKEDALVKIAQEKLYHQQITVAEGTPVANGVDGSVKELFPREIKPTFKERDDGTIDFKEMNIVTNVSEGQTICEITLPTDGKNGTNIYGATLRARPGRPSVVPQGENTVLTEDKTKLLAAVDGSLIFRKNKFCVDSVYTVSGDVDNAVGNINFNGDVVVKGNVQEGYEIHSKGNIRVEGVVEGASLYADGSILLVNGMNGMNHGTLQAKGEVTSKHLENCTISAGGNIKAESIINCKVESDGELEVSGKRGKIAGGKITVFGSITARQIGSHSSASTTIVLGVTPTIMKEKAALEEQIKKLTEQNAETAKNLAYLSHQETDGRLTSPEHKAMLNKLRIQAPISAMKEANLKKKLQEFNNQILDVGNCTLTCQKMYPTTKITIGNAVLIVQQEHENCRFYRNNKGEIAVGHT